MYTRMYAMHRMRYSINLQFHLHTITVLQKMTQFRQYTGLLTAIIVLSDKYCEITSRPITEWDYTKVLSHKIYLG